MNNDEQMRIIVGMFEKLERNQRTAIDMIYAKLKVSVVIQEDGRVMQITNIHETPEGVIIKVR